MSSWKAYYDLKKTAAWYDKHQFVVNPKREEIAEAIVNMFPCKKDAKISVLDLGAGTGFLTEKILKAYPEAIVTCVDGAKEMLKIAKTRLKSHLDRVSFQVRDFSKRGWNKSLGSFNVVASLFAIHHIQDRYKRTLYKQIYRMLEQNGYFLLGDLVKSRYDVFEEKYEDIWCKIIQQRAKDILGIERTLEQVKQKDRELRASQRDMPATVDEQIGWLREAGFSLAECVWKWYRLALFVALK